MKGHSQAGEEAARAAEWDVVVPAVVVAVVVVVVAAAAVRVAAAAVRVAAAVRAAAEAVSARLAGTESLMRRGTPATG